MGKRLSRPRPWVEPYANNSAEATVASIYIIGGGEELVAEVLAELMARGHDSAALRVLNDGAAAGEFVSVGEARFRIEVASEGAIENAEAAIFLGDGLLAKEFLPMLADRGTLVVDASPYARRMGVGTLVVPEVNGELLGAEERAQLFAFPMPATVGLSIALAPLHAHAAIRRVVTTVFEPASQRGVAGIELLSEQSVAMVSGEGVDREKYPETFAFNVRPQAAGSEGEGWAFDERMISQEIEALFPQPAFDVFTTIARVPVFVGAAQSLWVEFENNVSLEGVQEALRGAPSILLGGDELPEAMDEDARAVLLDQQAGPLDVAGSSAVHVGRLRLDPRRSDCLGMWIAFDDLRKGVALGVVSVFERAWGRFDAEY